MEKEFTPQLIGEPDSRKRAKIRELYELLAVSLNHVAHNLEYIYFQYGNLEKSDLVIEDVSTFILEVNKESAERSIYSTYAVIRKIEIPGLSFEKLVDQRLLDVDEASVMQAMKFREESLKLLREIETNGFIYPLRKLWTTKQDGLPRFEITPEFEAELNNAVSIYTENEEQNQILEIVNNLVNAINRMHNTRLLSVKHGLAMTTDFVEKMLECSRFKEVDPVYLNGKLFDRWSRGLVGLPKYKPVSRLNYKTMFNAVNDPAASCSPVEVQIPEPEQIEHP